MASGTLSVAVNYRILIHGAELQQQPFSGRNFWKLNRKRPIRGCIEISGCCM